MLSRLSGARVPGAGSEWVKIYFDGNPKPANDMTVSQMFSGANAPFLVPLVENYQNSSGGYVSYVPLCYHKAIEITTDFDRYYDIGYESYPPNADVKTWSPSDSTAQLQAEWVNATADPITTSGNTVDSGTVSLPPGVAQPLATIKGSDSIQSIKLSIPGVTASARTAAATRLDHIWIRAYWDGAKTPTSMPRLARSSPWVSSAPIRHTGLSLAWTPTTSCTCTCRCRSGARR